MVKQWDEIYQKEGCDYKYYDILKPHPDLLKVTEVFKAHGVKKVLDLGCGAGRNSIYLAQQGMDVQAIDSSAAGLQIFSEGLKKHGLHVESRVGNVLEPLPYDNASFDAIISVQVLQHGTLDQIILAISEIQRILKTGGIIFITLCGRLSKGKVRECLVRTAQKIAPRTYIPTLGSEVGLPHFIYNKKVLKQHYRAFTPIAMWKDDRDYYCFLAKKKL